ncbi:glucuronoxylan 4-O-methyltransferase 2 [Cicer arietinum]|uniref:Glucuronoxylan 4-O-methyltransferase 1 n=1 Tax=Cicer arietinum TaxID=3827 RepID=A0A1S2Z6A6_CICAR|nr:glucuronoxylan 4-O-methyltransferase 1 [Cicer arietinum]
MPPDILHFRPLVQFSPSLTTQAQEKQGTKGMNLTKKKLIHILLLILSIISILRILSLTLNNVSSSSSSSSPSPLFSTYNKVTSQTNEPSMHPRIPSNINTTFKEKEFKVLSNLISLKSPCNLLIFGFQPQFLILSSMNKAGNTVFLIEENDRTKTKVTITTANSNNTQIFNFNYNVPTKEAYKLLKHARNSPASCAPNPRYLQTSKCKLALKNLPVQVYEKNWDVIVVDGPSGDSIESPGRMASIYTASVLARRNGNSSDVIVHDVDRMIEKWFSWEFLCDENLLYSKGKLWHFRIRGLLNSTTFCSVIEK